MFPKYLHNGKSAEQVSAAVEGNFFWFKNISFCYVKHSARVQNTWTWRKGVNQKHIGWYRSSPEYQPLAAVNTYVWKLTECSEQNSCREEENTRSIKIKCR